MTGLQGLFPGDPSQIRIVIQPRKLLTHRNRPEKSLFPLKICYIILRSGERGRCLFLCVCLLRCSKFELTIQITIFSSLCGIRKRDGVDKPDFYQYMFRRNTEGIIKTFHLICLIFPMNKIVLNAADGKRVICQNYWHSRAVILVTTESEWMDVI